MKKPSVRTNMTFVMALISVFISPPSLISFLGLVPTVHALPGLRVAVDEPVSCCVRVHGDLSDRTERQHVDPAL